MYDDSRSACNSGRISPIAGPPVKTFPFQSLDGSARSATTNLVVEECISDIFRNSRHSQNVILTFHVPLGADTTVERVPLIPNQPESAGKILVQLSVEVDSNNLLE